MRSKATAIIGITGIRIRHPSKDSLFLLHIVQLHLHCYGYCMEYSSGNLGQVYESFLHQCGQVQEQPFHFHV